MSRRCTPVMSSLWTGLSLLVTDTYTQRLKSICVLQKSCKGEQNYKCCVHGMTVLKDKLMNKFTEVQHLSASLVCIGTMLIYGDTSYTAVSVRKSSHIHHVEDTIHITWLKNDTGKLHEEQVLRTYKYTAYVILEKQ
jgi:hypothetical protein